MFKPLDDVVASVELRSTPEEWPWLVKAGTKGRVVSLHKTGLFEVHFDNGVVRLCKKSELALR